MLSLRRFFMLLVVLVVSSFACLRQAWAMAERSVLEQSAVLAELGRWTRHAPRKLSFNGAILSLQTGQSEQPLTALLDHFSELCRARSGKLSNSLPRHRGTTAQRAFDGVLRIEDERQGLVACLDLGTEELSLPELGARLSGFARAGDLSVLGRLSLVRIESHAQGTFFVALSHEGPLPLFRMFPEQGDAPGQDPEGLPRPDGGRRVLSSFEVDAAASVTSYEVSEPPDVAFESYLRRLAKHGVQPRSPDALLSSRAPAAWVSLGSRHAIVNAVEFAQGSLVSVLTLDAP